MDATELLQAVLDSPTRHGIIVTDAEGRIQLWNRGAERIFQYRGDEVVGSSAKILFVADDLARGVPDREMETARRHGCAGDFRWHMRKDGSLFWADGMIYPMHGRAGELLGFVKVLRDATEEKKSGEETSRLALEDSLTGLPNRAEFHHRFVDMRAAAQRHGQLLLLLLLDFDHFKDVNDRHGHAVGDALLQQAAHRMRAVLRDTDFIARLGGDEFVVLMPDAQSAEAGGTMAERLVDALSQPFHVRRAPLRIGASVGISVYPQDAAELETLFAQADLALYRAKAEGRSAYRYYTPEMDALAHRHTQELAQLRRAVKNRAFELYYQPRIDAIGARPVAVEVLLRCVVPSFAGYRSEELVALAVEAGRMRRLGLWVLAEAMRQVRRWQLEGHPELVLGVNVTRSEFTNSRFAERVTELLAAMQLSPRHLQLEIAESQLPDPQHTAQIRALHAAGASIVADNVGGGGLALKHLFELPIDAVKLDLQFLPGLPGDARCRAIVTGVVQLAHALGMRVMAERVESAAQVDYLRLLCDSLQGHRIAEPMTAEAMGQWLRQRLAEAQWRAPRNA